MSWFSSVERAADITEVVDHRIDLGTAQGLHGWVVLQFSPGRVDLLLCSVDRFNQRCRIDARFDRRLQPSQPLFGLGDGPGCRLPACRGSLAGIGVQHPADRVPRCSFANRLPIHALIGPTTAFSGRYTFHGCVARIGDPGTMLRAAHR